MCCYSFFSPSNKISNPSAIILQENKLYSALFGQYLKRLDVFCCVCDEVCFDIILYVCMEQLYCSLYCLVWVSNEYTFVHRTLILNAVILLRRYIYCGIVTGIMHVFVYVLYVVHCIQTLCWNQNWRSLLITSC